MAEEQAAVSADEETGSEEEVTEAGSSAEGETEEKDESATSEEEKREASEEDTGESEEEEQEEEKPKKREGGFQRRIRKLTAREAAAREEADYWRQKALDRGEEKPAAPAPPGGKPEPRPEDFKLEDGEYDQAAYTKALVTWQAEQVIAQRDAEQKATQVRTQEQQAAQAFLQRETTFAEAHADYEEAADAALGFLGQNRTSPASAAIANAITASEEGPALLYHLGNNPDDLDRISKLNPHSAVMALGRIGAQLAGTEKKGDSEARTSPVSKAPKPLTPPRRAAGGKPARPDDPETADKMSPEEWQKARAKQVRDRAKRG